MEAMRQSETRCSSLQICLVGRILTAQAIFQLLSSLMGYWTSALGTRKYAFDSMCAITPERYVNTGARASQCSLECYPYDAEPVDKHSNADQVKLSDSLTRHQHFRQIRSIRGISGEVWFREAQSHTRISGSAQEECVNPGSKARKSGTWQRHREFLRSMMPKLRGIISSTYLLTYRLTVQSNIKWPSRGGCLCSS